MPGVSLLHCFAWLCFFHNFCVLAVRQDLITLTKQTLAVCLFCSECKLVLSISVSTFTSMFTSICDGGLCELCCDVTAVDVNYVVM